MINRLSRAIGHLESVKRMVERGEDCSEVLIQLAAVRNGSVLFGRKCVCKKQKQARRHLFLFFCGSFRDMKTMRIFTHRPG